MKKLSAFGRSVILATVGLGLLPSKPAAGSTVARGYFHGLGLRSKRIQRALLLSGIILCVAAGEVALAFHEGHLASLPDFDRRAGARGQGLDPQRQLAADMLKQRLPSLKIDLDEITGAPAWIRGEQFLSAPDLTAVPVAQGAGLLANPIDLHGPVKKFLDQNVNLFGHGSEVLASARISRDFVTAHNQMRTIVWQQYLDDIPVLEATLIGHITRFGELVCVGSRFVPTVDQAVRLDPIARGRLALNPPVDVREAIVIAAQTVEEQLDARQLAAVDQFPRGAQMKQRFRGLPSIRKAEAELVWVPVERNSLRLCWRVVLNCPRRDESYEVIVDARNREALLRRCLTWHISDVTYRVFAGGSPSPFSPGWSSPNTNQPATTSNVLVTLKAVSTNASPNGWINDGVNKTIGNNVDGRLDWYGYGDDEDYGMGSNVTESSSRVYDYNADLTQDPTSSPTFSAAVVSLFYWCNWMHDRLYDLGFTEAAGNFQQTNFGRGGVEGDAILAEAQDLRFPPSGSPFYNNANFTPAADGTAGRIQMYIWNGPVPDRGGDFDSEIMIHEYSHGLSTRRVGGGNALSNTGQGGGLGEGWSDFYALALLSKATNDLYGCYPAGAYSTLNFGATNVFLENYYYGIRRYPYSVDRTKNPLTYKDIDPTQASPHTGVPMNPLYGPVFGTDPSEVHRQGEVWCVTLWDVRSKIIEKMGWTNGSPLFLRLVTDGMNLTPGFPTFLQARDGILLADKVNNGGTNLAELWAGFAGRGMGYGALSPSSSTTIGVVETYDVPPNYTNIWHWTFGASGSITSSPAIGADGTIYFGANDSKVYAVNPNGALKWTFASTNANAQFSSSPAISLDQTIYIGCNDSNLYAINPNGTLRWSRNLGGAVFSSPAIGLDGTIYVGSHNYQVHAYQTNGNVKSGWPYSTGGAVHSSPAIGTNGTIYVGSLDGYLYALNPNGTLAWSQNLGSPIYASPAIGWEYMVFVGCDDGKMYGFKHDGTPKWTNATSASIRSSPVQGRLPVVYVGNQNGTLYRLHVLQGTALWTFTASAAIASTPIVAADDAIYFGTVDGKLYGVGSSGTQIWLRTNLGPVISSPIIGENGMLYLGTANSNLHALHVPAPMARYSWGGFGGNLRHSGNANHRIIRTGGVTASNIVLVVSAQHNQTNIIQSSTDLTTWTSIGTNSATAIQFGLSYMTNTCSNCFYRVTTPDGTLASLNVLGKANVSAPYGYAMIANHFNHPGGNTVGAVIPEAPDGTTLFRWNETVQQYEDSNTYITGWGWYPAPNMTLSPGEGVIFQNILTNPMTLTFFGEVSQGYLVQSFPSNLSMRSSMVPKAGQLDTVLGFPVRNGDVFYRMTSATPTYTTNSYSNNQWVTPPGALSPNLGESFWINAPTGRTWSVTFSIAP